MFGAQGWGEGGGAHLDRSTTGEEERETMSVYIS